MSSKFDLSSSKQFEVRYIWVQSNFKIGMYEEKSIGIFFNLSHATYLEHEVVPVSLAGDPERDCIEEALAIRSKEKEANFVIGTDLGGEGFSAD